MTHFNHNRPFPRTISPFDCEHDEILRLSKKAQHTAEVIGFTIGLVMGSGITLVIVGLLR